MLVTCAHINKCLPGRSRLPKAIKSPTNNLVALQKTAARYVIDLNLLVVTGGCQQFAILITAPAVHITGIVNAAAKFWTRGDGFVDPIGSVQLTLSVAAPANNGAIGSKCTRVVLGGRDHGVDPLGRCVNSRRLVVAPAVQSSLSVNAAGGFSPCA